MNIFDTSASAPWFNRGSVWDDFGSILGTPFDEFSSEESSPKINVYKEGGKIIVTAEAAGVQADDIKVDIHDTRLAISGESKGRSRSSSEVFHRCERSVGKFHRELRLPFRVDANKVTAECRNGILTISLHQLEEDQPKTITVKAV